MFVQVQIDDFIAVETTRSFTRVARAIGMPHPKLNFGDRPVPVAASI